MEGDEFHKSGGQVPADGEPSVLLQDHWPVSSITSKAALCCNSQRITARRAELLTSQKCEEQGRPKWSSRRWSLLMEK